MRLIFDIDPSYYDSCQDENENLTLMVPQMMNPSDFGDPLTGALYQEVDTSGLEWTNGWIAIKL